MASSRLWRDERLPPFSAFADPEPWVRRGTPPDAHGPAAVDHLFLPLLGGDATDSKSVGLRVEKKEARYERKSFSAPYLVNLVEAAREGEAPDGVFIFGGKMPSMQCFPESAFHSPMLTSADTM